ncbi:5'-Nucleotidase domain-containing protein [Halothece sp. PCC 7418]|nr:choice-of-anchor I family protein [Halothece sp. PCC 7418]AFZ42326.1 5'-Nucleotidase domain-containing protein [Halothece sp. PCC 7418]
MSDSLVESVAFDIVHTNRELTITTSDHEPLLANFNFTGDDDMAINLNPIGTFTTGVFDEGAAEIVAYEAGTQSLFVINSDATTVDILDLSDPTNPTRIDQIDATQFGDGANSVAVNNGVIAVAIEGETVDSNGQVLLFNTSGGEPALVEVGVLPDMVTFTPDGTKVLVANEGEPNDDYTVDPEGSVSIIDLEAGTVSNADFTAFNDQKEALINRGVRIFGPNATVAQDLEPEYITVTPDSTTAYVSLQENNALAVVDLETATVQDILPLGFKDHSRGLPTLEQFEISDTVLEANSLLLGNSDDPSGVPLGGLSGLFFEGVDEDGNLEFITHPDRGPDLGSEDLDGDGENDVRVFALPDFQPSLNRFELNPETGEITFTETIGLTRQDGTPLTGLPNLEGDDSGRQGQDAEGNLLDFDPFGADMEGVVVNPADGTFWTVDEYRPSIYHFDTDGTLIDRFVPAGTDPNPDDDVTFGSETLPEDYLSARDNRGFEAVSLDTEEGILYAFIQTPLGTDGTGEFNRDVSDNSQVIRMLGIDPATGNPVAEYVYLLEKPAFSEGNIDKIGAATFAGDGKFFVVERDSGTEPTSNKVVYEINLSGATNLLAEDAPSLPEGTTLEQLNADELADQGIQAVSKTEVTNLPSLGYLPSDKPEGIALLDDGSLAVLNDNDFEPETKDTSLGIISFNQSNQIDASDEDGINFQNIPSFGMLQPDAIDSFAVDGQNYIITANEGDARDYDTFSEEVGLDDLLENGLLDLNDDDNPDTETDVASTGETIAELLAEDRLGELDFTNATGDIDGDGLIEQLYNYGGRSFSILDQFGNLVFDSGDQFEKIIADQIEQGILPEIAFNNDNDENEFDARSDAKGPEPEAIVTGMVDDTPYAFIGLERIGGVMVYELSNPSEPEFIQYINNRNFVDENGEPISVQLEDESLNPAVGDLGPEGFDFIPAEDSPNDQPLLAVGNEVSGSTTIYSVADMVEEPEPIEAPEPTNELELSVAGRFETGVFDEGAAEIVAYDAGSERLFVINSDAVTVDILNLSDPGNPVANPMTEAQQVEDVPDGSATGDYIFTISEDNTLAVRGTFSGLSSPLFQVGPEEDAEGNPQSAIHIHTGVAGENGPILRNLTVDTFDDGLSGVFSGEFNLTEEEAELARTEGLYVNLHTENFNSGEIRGQFVQPSIDATSFGDGANSVAVNDGIVAVAIEAEEIDANGQVVFFDTEGNVINSVEVGILPDMVTFSPDGNTVLVANEGEPSDDYSIDPEGSVSIIDISDSVENATVTNAGFTDFNDQQAALEESGVRIFGPDATVAQDLEPEYITVNAESTTAYVSLQENNAFAVVDLNAGEVTDILPLGFKDHSLPENELDASDEDSINFQTIPSLGMLQPDSIASFEVDGESYIVTANEGDARDYDTFSEEVGLDDLLENELLDLNDDDTPDVETDVASTGETIAELLAEDRLGELDFTSATGDTDGDGLIEQLYNYGGRSFSVFDESGNLIFDSGDDFEKIIADQIQQGILPEIAFNNDNDVNEFDARSDAKGPEPEAIATGVIEGTPYAFIGLERIGGIMVYNLSDPTSPEFVEYINNRNFVDDNGDPISVQLEDESLNPAAGDLGPEGFDFISAEESPNGQPLLAVGNEISGSTTIYNIDVAQQETFTLELLHAADQEGAAPAVSDAPNFSAVLNALREQDLGNDGLEDNTLTLSSGDAFIGGVFFEASEAVYGANGIGDIQIQNELGFSAIALGNHEFDFGTETLASLIDGSAGEDPENPDSGTILGSDFTGANFPYLATNLDFSTDENLSPLEVEGGQPPQPNTVTSSTLIDVNGENIGVLGATTPNLAALSSPGNVGISPSPFNTNPTDAQLDALASEIQSEVDLLLADNPDLNKVVLLAHMQQLSIEEALAERLENVDIIVGGGSNTRLFDENDRPREGDSVQGEYPKFITNAGGTSTAVVNTDGSYKYVGRLVLDFDAEGNIIPESYDANVSGAYATDDQGVADLNAGDLVDPEVQQIADEIEAQIIETESNLFGLSDVFLNGNRSGGPLDGVRTQETNLGNLTADANLAEAQETDPTVVASIKNGGGIRASIGETLVPPGGNEAVRIPNEEIVIDGELVKPEGGISQTDIVTTLAFNNGLTLLTLTKEELVDVLEHGVSALPEVAGQFPQIAGVEFSYDPELPSGDRIQEASIVDESGNSIAELVDNGEIVGDATEEFRIVTLGFLAEPRFDDEGNFISGGDGYPFPNTNTDPEVGAVGNSEVIERVNLVQLTQEGVQTGEATFADDGTEQDALAEYLAENFPADDDPNTPVFSQEDTPVSEDTRIVNLSLQEPEPEPEPEPEELSFGGLEADTLEATVDFAGENSLVFAGEGDDAIFAAEGSGGNRIYAGAGDDEIVAGTDDRVFGGAGNDILEATVGSGNRLSGGVGDDDFFAGSNNRLVGGDGSDRAFFVEGGNNTVTGGADADQFWLANGDLPESANIITDFSAGEDVLGIAGVDLEFSDLVIGSSENNTVIATSDQDLAILLGVQADTISEDNFVFETGTVS